MQFHLEERQAWIRTSTHCVIHDRDPDFARFAANKTGILARLIRIWQVATPADGPRNYLGSVCLGPLGFRQRDLRRIFRRALECALTADECRTTTRRQLRALLESARPNTDQI